MDDDESAGAGDDQAEETDDACSEGGTVLENASDAEDFAVEFGEPSDPRPMALNHSADQGTVIHCYLR